MDQLNSERLESAEAKLTHERRANLRLRWRSTLWITLTFSLVLLLVASLLFTAGIAVEPDSTFLKTLAGFVCSIAFSFLSPTLLALLYTKFVEQHHISEAAERIGTIVRDHLRQQSETTGDVVRTYEQRADIDWRTFFNSANDQIRILCTNLQNVGDDIAEHIVRVLQNKPKVNVRIIVLNPQHDFLKTRAPELNLSPKDFAGRMTSSLRKLWTEVTKEVPDHGDRFQLRVTVSTPSVMLFGADARMIAGFILRQSRSGRTVHVEFDCGQNDGNNQRKAKCLEDHFETLWNQATDVDEELLRTFDNWHSQLVDEPQPRIEETAVKGRPV